MINELEAYKKNKEFINRILNMEKEIKELREDLKNIKETISKG